MEEYLRDYSEDMQTNMRGYHPQPRNGMVVQRYQFYCAPGTSTETIIWGRPENVILERRPEPTVINAYLTDDIWPHPRCWDPHGPATNQVDVRNASIVSFISSFCNDEYWDLWDYTSGFNDVQLNNIRRIANMTNMIRGDGMLIQETGPLSNNMDCNQPIELPAFNPQTPFEDRPYYIQRETVANIHEARFLSSQMGFNETTELPTLAFNPQMPFAERHYNINVANVTNIRQTDGMQIQESELLSSNYIAELPTLAFNSRMPFADWPYDINVANVANLLQGYGASNLQESEFLGSSMGFNQIPEPTTGTFGENMNQNTQTYAPHWMSNWESQENSTMTIRSSIWQTPFRQPTYPVPDFNNENVEYDSGEFLIHTDFAQ